MAVKKKAAAKKKVAAKKGVTKKGATQKPAIGTKQTKTQIVSAIAEETGLSKKEVGAVFSSLTGLVERHMKKRGSGEITIPEVGVKIRRVRKPATKARKMISPFSGEEITVAAKPARSQVKVAPLKALKETVNK